MEPTPVNPPATPPMSMEPPVSTPLPIEPAPSPTPAPAPMPANHAATPQYSKGGFLGGVFDGISFTDVGMIALVTVGMCYVIRYYRNKINYTKNEKSQVVKDMEEVKTNVQNFLGEGYHKMY